MACENENISKRCISQFNIPVFSLPSCPNVSLSASHTPATQQARHTLRWMHFFCCCACPHRSFVMGVLDVVSRRGSWYGGTGNWLFEILDSTVTSHLFVVRRLILSATNTWRKILCRLGRLMFPCVLHERPRPAQMTPSPFTFKLILIGRLRAVFNVFLHFTIKLFAGKIFPTQTEPSRLRARNLKFTLHKRIKDMLGHR